MLAEPLTTSGPWYLPSLGGNQPPATPQATQPQRGHAPPISHSPCTFLSLGCPHGQSGCNSLPFVPRGGAPGIILTGSRLLRTAPRAAQSPPKPPPSLSNSVVMSTEALVIIPNTPVHYRSRFANRSGQKGPYDPTEGRRRPPKCPMGPPICPSI